MVFANAHGLKYARNAAGRTHRLAGVAARKHGAFAVFQPGCHSHKGLGQLLERLALHLFVHIIFQLLAQNQPARGPLQVADFGLVQRHGFFLQLKRSHAAGIQCADHTARAGARHHGRREAVGLQHLDHANVRKALGCAAAQGHADLDRGCGRGGGFGCRSGCGRGWWGAAASS